MIQTLRSLPLPVIELLALAGVCGQACPALAQSAPAVDRTATDVKAEELDQSGMALLKQGKIAEACPRFAESFRIRPGTGVLMRLALCHEQSGKWASAWRAYRDAAARATTSGDSAVVVLAQKRAAAVEPRLSRLVLRLDASTSAVQGLEVMCDGNALPLTANGVALELDPGEHVVTASAPGRFPFSQTVRVGEGAGNYEVAISLPLQQTITTAPPTASGATSVQQQQAAYWSPQRKAAVAAGGIGVVGVVVGAVFGLKVASKMDQARDRCGGGTSGCPPDSLTLQDQAETPARISTAAFTLGVLGLAGGAALWFTAPERTKPEGALGLQLRPLLARDAGSITMSGHW